MYPNTAKLLPWDTEKHSNIHLKNRGVQPYFFKTRTNSLDQKITIKILKSYKVLTPIGSAIIFTFNDGSKRHSATEFYGMPKV